jgi:hypothetical protein
MADDFSSTFANALLNVLANTAPTLYSTVYIELHTAAPGSAGTTSVSAGSATRASATFAAASAGSISLNSTPSWTNGGASETITDIAVWSAASGGTFLFSAQFATSKAWASTDQIQLSSLSVSFPTAS